MIISNNGCRGAASPTPVRRPRRHRTSRLVRVIVATAVAVAAGVGAQPSSWTVNGPAMPIREFIAQVAEITGRTIVVDTAVKSQEVTIFSNVPLDADGVYELFLTVIKVNNLVASDANDVITVTRQQAAKWSGELVSGEDVSPHDLLITRVIPVKHVASSELVKTMRTMLAQNAHMAAIASPNVVIVAAYAGNMRRIMAVIEQIDMVDPDEIVHRVLDHAWVGTVAALLEEIDPELLGRNAKGPRRVQIVANERNNSLILKGKSRPIAAALRIIDRLDVPETAGGGATVIRLNHADALDTAEKLSAVVNERSGGEGAQPTATIQAVESLNALILRANPTTLNELLAIISQLDVRRAQVLIEVAVVEVSVNNVDTRGLEIVAGDARGTSVPLVSTTLNGIIGGLLKRIGESTDGENATVDPVAVASGLTAPTIAVAKLDGDGISFGAVLSAMLTDTRANLLSTPSVLTLDNSEAEYFSGQQVPFRTGSFTTTTDGSQNPFQTISREQVGVTLNVTPHVHEDLSMRLAIDLTVGNVLDSAESGLNAADVLTAERKLKTTVLADDRQIILLGGLIQDDYRDTKRKVPLLGDVPLLGRAFRSKRETLLKRHLLMFLRPTVLISGADAADTAHRRYQGIYRLRGDSRAPVSEEIESVFEGVGVEEDDEDSAAVDEATEAAEG